ncbi:MAG TPA: tripartite tricarboxylate transporter substrate-binding protein [Burkholderiales bacterium]
MRFLFLLSMFVMASAAAQYPNKPVRVFVGYAAGSSTDIVARVMADRLGAYWKQSVYVETRAGAAGNLAADAAAKAAGDGYTLLFAQNGLAISAAALPNLPYKAETDLLPLAPVAATPHILIVAPESKAKNVQALVAQAKAAPGKLSFASSGVGNSDHLCGELFNLMAGIQAIHVPYKGGAPAAVDVMGGRISYYFAGMPVGLPLAKSGKARALAVTSKVRFNGAPDVPTVAEQGLPEYEATLWQGFFAPASMPPEMGARIAADIETVLRRPETREKLLGAGVSLFEADHGTFKRYFHDEVEKWRGVVKKANLKLE